MSSNHSDARAGWVNVTLKGMIAMQEHKNFWDKNAGRYDRFMRKDRAAYDEMYELIRMLYAECVKSEV